MWIKKVFIYAMDKLKSIKEKDHAGIEELLE